MLRFCSAFVSALLVLLPLGASANTLAGTVRVHDGDDLVVDGTRVRLFGIDAPERAQTCVTEHGVRWSCGEDVRKRLAERYDGRRATCQGQGTGHYGRALGVCFVEGENVNDWLVSQGWAFAYRRYSMMFDASENNAAANRRGLHATGYQVPSTYRQIDRQHRKARSIASAPKPPSQDCAIKGNISRGSESKIYHMPGQQNYADTVIRPSQGEQWFCSAAQAEAMGWRAAKR